MAAKKENKKVEKIIQEEEGKLMKVSYVGEQYTVNLRSK